MSFRTLRCPGGLSRSLDCLCSPCACSSPGRLVHTPPPCVSYPKSSRRTPLLLRPLALPAAIALHHVPHCARRLVSPLLNPRLNLYGLEGSFTGNPFLKRRHAAFAFWRTRHERERDCFVGGRESVVHERPCLGACSRGSVRRIVRGRRGRQSGHGNKRLVLHAHAHAHTTGQSATPTSRGVRGLRLHRREDRCRAPDHP